MTEDLLGYYNRELTNLRQQAAAFAKAHPKVAARLRLDADGSEDPHVERLLEGFAYLTAGVRQQLDDGYSKFAESLMGVLYPHYLAPVPSSAIIQMELGPSQNELLNGVVIPTGQTVTTDPIQGEPCRFRTSYPVNLWPINVSQATLQAAPFTAPQTSKSGTAAAVLRLQFALKSPTAMFTKVPLKTIRLYLNGQAQHTNRVLELLLHRATQVAFGIPGVAEPVVAEPSAITPVGYELEDGLYPYPERSLPAYRLLTEFFAFPRKFHFVDIKIPQAVRERGGNKFDVYIYLDRAINELEAVVAPDMFRMGCTPMVNLFSKRCEPIRWTKYESEYRVIPDIRRPLAHEVYSIDKVVATTPAGAERELKPMYSAKHLAQGDELYWQDSRRILEIQPDGPVDRGSEVYLQFSESSRAGELPFDSVIHVETTCLSRDLPAQLPYGGGQPKLKLATGGVAVGAITCLTPPSATLRPKLGPDSVWRLLSHLHLNHLSIVDGTWGAASLRSILSLYDLYDRPDTRNTIDGLIEIRTQRVTGRIGTSIARGIEVEATLDEERFSGGGLFVFASVLERFIALYASINSFSRLVVKTKSQEGIYRRWPGRSGTRVLA